MQRTLVTLGLTHTHAHQAEDAGDTDAADAAGAGSSQVICIVRLMYLVVLV